MTTKAKSKMRFSLYIHANEFKGIIAYSSSTNNCFHSVIDAVMKYR